VQSVKDNKGKKIVLEWQNETSQQHHKATLVPRVSPPKMKVHLVSHFSQQKQLCFPTIHLSKKSFRYYSSSRSDAYNFDVLKSLIDVSLKEKTVAPN